MLETGLVFDRNGRTIYWHEPLGREGGAIPDTRELWDVLWANRHDLGGVAHTHPWDGPAQPSGKDLTTFDALERGLGRHLLWPVVTFTEVLYVVHNPLFGQGSTHPWTSVKHLGIEIDGIEELRARSRK